LAQVHEQLLLFPSLNLHKFITPFSTVQYLENKIGILDGGKIAGGKIAGGKIAGGKIAPPT
jgi:hypothetical protein